MQLKFITLNLFEGGLLFEKIISFLRKEQPDILALQEVYNGLGKSISKHLKSVKFLSRELNGFDYFFSPELIDNRKEGKFEYGNAIFSRFPIVFSETIFLNSTLREIRNANRRGGYDKDPKNMQHILIRPNNENINVFNLHGIWGLDGKDNKRRIKMSNIIVDKIKEEENVILAGDFNLPPNTKTIQKIEEHLTNVFKDELTTTFNVKHKDNPGYATSVVDMIFISKNIKVVDHYCPNLDISDHFPLVCVLEI